MEIAGLGELVEDADYEAYRSEPVAVRDGAEVTKVGPYDGHLTDA
jgi:hypothetical protein